jgi:hypothetical protein
MIVCKIPFFLLQAPAKTTTTGKAGAKDNSENTENEVRYFQSVLLVASSLAYSQDYI